MILTHLKTSSRYLFKSVLDFVEIMPRVKRTRAKSGNVPDAKKLKQTNSVVDYVSQIQSALGTSQSKQKNDADQKGTEQIPALPDSISDALLSIEQKLCAELRDITFPSSVHYIYNPLEYAFETHAMYVRKYCTGVKKILFLGMNPGPWGMSQTGVPFGEIKMVRDWLEISGPVGNPSKEHPDRKITGFQCTRSEVSGLRLWGLFRELCGNTENFFRHAYMHNYCPLAFMDARARNVTPAELKGDGQQTLHEACDKSLVEIARLLKAEIIVGIGKYAEKRAQTAVQTAGLPVQVMVLRHPSPRAAGNQNWSVIAMQQMKELGLLKFFEKADVTV